MSVAREHAERIAALARLRFEADELTRITEDLNHILDHVEVLRTLEAAAEAEWEGVTPATAESTTRGAGAERPDALGRGIEAFAPDAREGFFVVPPFPGVHDAEGA